MDLELRERMVRVEEELKAQRQLVRQGFEQVDRRFEAIDSRFDAMDRRLDTMDGRFETIDRRFEKVDQRFDSLLERQDRHFRWLLGFMLSCAGVVIAAQRWL